MGVRDAMRETIDSLSVRRVVSEPIERDGVTLVPVARMRGGGGGGEGGEGAASGWGGGYGLEARGIGAYVLKDGDARWVPALDVTRIVLGGQALTIAALCTARSLARVRARRRRHAAA